MLVLKILFWIVAVSLVLIFTVSFMNSTGDKEPRKKYADLFVGVVVFAVFLVLIRVLGGYVL